MKKLVLFSLFVGMGLSAFAKHVDVATAKRVGFNFLNTQNVAAGSTADELQLAYTSQSLTGGDSYFYVFNAGNAGFVMVAADDQVIPVFGYSNESGFNASNIAPATAAWFNNYAEQVKYVIEHNSPATSKISEDWATLLNKANPDNTGSKTTAGSGTPLVSTKWNQSTYYNDLCPFDGGQNKLSVTGCVATAMAQVMKYWNYPAQGNGTHGYNHSVYGYLDADFGSTTYDWAAMPTGLSNANNAVATLMYHCGVAVNMNYSPSSSGAYVIDAMGSNTAESALRNYFGYSQSLKGIQRGSYSDQNWINKIEDEIDNNRPVIYAGFGSGGHCWVADGYDANDKIHMNWGWGGSSDGYYTVDALNPPALGAGGSNGGFNNGQHAIVGVQPTNMPAGDVYEANNNEAKTHTFPVKFTGNTCNINTAGSTLHTANDVDYYSVFLPIGDNYVVTARLHDAKNSGNGNIYTLDAKAAYKGVNSSSWSPYQEDVFANSLTINGGGLINFRVVPVVAATTGTYQFDITISRTVTGISDINNDAKPVIYPNPASSVINIDLAKIKGEVAISLIDIQGREVAHIAKSGNKLVTIPVNTLPNGMYFVKIQSENGTVTEKISVTK